MLSYTKAGAACNTIRANYVGSDTCAGGGITVKGTAPALVLCRELIAAGVDPDRALEVYRGAILALRVRSIRDGARLRVAPHGVGFQWVEECTAAPPMRQTELADAEAAAP